MTEIDLSARADRVRAVVAALHGKIVDHAGNTMTELKDLEKLLADIENSVLLNGVPVRWHAAASDKIVELRELLRQMWRLTSVVHRN